MSDKIEVVDAEGKRAGDLICVYQQWVHGRKRMGLPWEAEAAALWQVIWAANRERLPVRA